MKKTLFLALALGLATLSQATIINTTGNVVTGSDSLITDTMVTTVGTSSGAGDVTVQPGVAWTLPNALYIGGSGNYSGDANTSGNNGTVSIGAGSKIIVGNAYPADSTGVNHHIDVGNSKFAVTGILNIDGGEIITEQLVVGQNAGTGIVNVTNGGKITLQHTMGSATAFHGLSIGANDTPGLTNSGTGRVVVENGSIENTGVVTSIGTHGVGELVVKNNTAEVTLGDVVVGSEAGASSGAITVADGGSLTIEKAAVVNKSGAVEITDGAVSLTGATIDDGLYVEEGSVKVSGSNASLQSSYIGLNGDDTFGYSSAAGMTVTDGAFVSAGEIVISQDSVLTVDASRDSNTQMAVEFATSIDMGGKLVVIGDGSGHPGSADGNFETAELNVGTIYGTGSVVLDEGAKLVTTGATSVYTGDSTTSHSSMTLSNSAAWESRNEVSVDAGSVLNFTVTHDNRELGQMHMANMSDNCTIDGTVNVTVDSSLIGDLMNGETSIRLISYDSDGKFVDMNAGSDIVWNGQSIKETWDKESSGTATHGLNLNLEKSSNEHLVEDIINSLLSPATGAAVNTLNGTLANMTGFLHVVKSQAQMPHNVDLPVGNVAEDSRMAYTGRYFVGANRVWATALGAADRVATDNHGDGYHYNGGGYAVGYDRIITPEMYVGAAIGQMIGKYKSNNMLVRDSQKTYEGSLYAHYTHNMKKSDNRFNVDAYVGAGRARNRARGAFYTDSPATATGRWNDTTFGCGVTLSYDIMLTDEHMLTPFVGIEGAYAWQNSFRMSDGTVNVDYHDGSTSLWTVPVGMTYRYIAAVSKTEYIIPQLTVAYLGDIHRHEPTVKYNWKNGSGRVKGAKPNNQGAEIEAGVTWIMSSEWATGAFYTLEERSGDCNQQLKVFVSHSF